MKERKGERLYGKRKKVIYMKKRGGGVKWDFNLF